MEEVEGDQFINSLAQAIRASPRFVCNSRMILCFPTSGEETVCAIGVFRNTGNGSWEGGLPPQK